MKSALICLDLQNKFFEYGSLPLFQTKGIVPKINELLKEFELVIFANDYYEPDFNHDIPGDRDLVPQLKLTNCKDKFYIFKREYNSTIQYPSAFTPLVPRTKKVSELNKFLEERNIERIFICGINAEYALKATAIESKNIYGYETFVVLDNTYFIGNKRQSVIEELLESGVIVIDNLSYLLFK